MMPELVLAVATATVGCDARGLPGYACVEPRVLWETAERWRVKATDARTALVLCEAGKRQANEAHVAAASIPLEPEPRAPDPDAGERYPSGAVRLAVWVGGALASGAVFVVALVRD
jgi:hypothetical protein